MAKGSRCKSYYSSQTAYFCAALRIQMLEDFRHRIIDFSRPERHAGGGPWLFATNSLSFLLLPGPTTFGLTFKTTPRADGLIAQHQAAMRRRGVGPGVSQRFETRAFLKPLARPVSAGCPGTVAGRASSVSAR